MPHTFDPVEYADALGLRVVERPLDRIVQAWIPQARTLLVSTQHAEHRRGTITHLLGHKTCARYLGTQSNHPHEWQADRWAARKTITPRVLATHPSLDSDSLADMLHVTPEQVDVYRQTYSTAA